MPCLDALLVIGPLTFLFEIFVRSVSPLLCGTSIDIYDVGVDGTSKLLGCII